MNVGIEYIASLFDTEVKARGGWRGEQELQRRIVYRCGSGFSGFTAKTSLAGPRW